MTNPEAQFSTLLSLVLICFTVGYETRPPRSYLGLGLVLLPFIGASVVNDFEASDLAAALVFFVGPWTVGAVTRDRAESAEAAVARADRLEREREAEAARVAEQERTRIARELHDIVSHSISVVTIQTQAVRRRLGPDHAREAEDLMAVEATAREALAEMRRLFGVLRADGESASLAPQPGLTELGRLVDRRALGRPPAALQVEGDPVEPARASTSRRTASPRKASPTPCATAAPATPGHPALEPTHLDVGSRTTVAAYPPAGERRPRPGRHPGAGGAVRRYRAARAHHRRRHPAGRDPALEGPRVTRIVICDDQGMVRAGFKSCWSPSPTSRSSARPRRPGGRGSRHAPPARRDADGHPDAGARRARRHPAPGRGPGADERAGADDLRPGRVRLRGPPGRGERLPAQGRPGRGLAAAIRVVAAGDSLLAPGVTRRVIDAFVRRADPSTRPRTGRRASRTPREQEVLGLLARGLSNLDIGRRLFVSEGTTKTHVSNVLTKLGLRDRVQAVIYAYENGVVVPGTAGGGGVGAF